jgi:hypothetical protein
MSFSYGDNHCQDLVFRLYIVEPGGDNTNYGVPVGAGSAAWQTWDDTTGTRQF